MKYLATISTLALLVVGYAGDALADVAASGEALGGDAYLAQAGEPEAALASDAEPGRGGRAQLGSFVVGVHLAPLVPVFSDLDVFFLPRLELGYHLPPWGRRLEIFFSIAYTAPGADGSRSDARVPGGAFTWELTQAQLMLGLGLYLRFFELGERINPYVGLAPLLFLLETTATGAAGGEPFGENTAQGTEVGLYGAAGVELVLGPGAGFFELGVTWSDLENPITGDSNTGALAPTLGYRFMF